MTIKPFAIYARQSLDHEGAGLAVARQIEDCVSLAERLSLPGKAVIYSDNDVSATSRRRRPGYEDLLDELRAEVHDVLLVWHNDRLHRRPLELEEFIAIAEAVQLKVYTVQAGELDLSTPSGRMVARIVGAVARQEVEHKGARRRRSNLQRALMGYRAGGTRGFGYGSTVVENGARHDRDLLRINRREAAAIRDAAVRMIAGESTTSIWRSWNEAGLRTPQGNLWQASTFARTMRRPALVGQVVYRKQVVDGVTAKAPAILTQAQLAAVDGIFARPERLQPRRQPIRELLDRVATCGHCGEPLRVRLNVGRPRDDGSRRRFRTYQCPAKPTPGHCAIVIRAVDRAVEAAVIDILVRICRDPAGSGAEKAAQQAMRMELEQIREREQRVTAAIADGVLTRAMAERTLRRIRADRTRVVAALGETTPSSSGGDEPYAIAERFLRGLPTMTLAYWPVWFSQNPHLQTMAIREQVEEAFAALPLLVKQAIVRSTVRVVVTPVADGGQRVAITPV